MKVILRETLPGPTSSPSGGDVGEILSFRNVDGRCVFTAIFYGYPGTFQIDLSQVNALVE